MFSLYPSNRKTSVSIRLINRAVITIWQLRLFPTTKSNRMKKPCIATLYGYIYEFLESVLIHHLCGSPAFEIGKNRVVGAMVVSTNCTACS